MHAPGKNMAVRGRDPLLDACRICCCTPRTKGCPRQQRMLPLTVSSMSNIRRALLQGFGKPVARRFMLRSCRCRLLSNLGGIESIPQVLLGCGVDTLSELSSVSGHADLTRLEAGLSVHPSNRGLATPDCP